MMQSHTVTLERAIGVAAWIIGGCLMLAGWIVYLRDFADLGVMLVVTSMPFVVTAALLMIRGWAAGVCRLVRLVGGVPQDSPGGVAPFR